MTRPVLRLLEGKSAVTCACGANGGVRECGQVVRTPLGVFSSTPYVECYFMADIPRLTKGKCHEPSTIFRAMNSRNAAHFWKHF
jgi:hypothetical protein